MGMILSDKVNPVLLRELRRLARNGFVITVVSLFLVAIFVGAVLLLGEAARNNGRADEEYSYIGFILLASSVMVGAIPFLVFLRHSAQSRLDKDDLLFLTGLKPRQIVDGMALSGFIGSMLLLSVMFPVLMLGLLVSSADLVWIIIFAVMLSLLSVCANYSAVACASMRRFAAIRYISVGLTALPFTLAILILAIYSTELSWNNDDLWSALIVLAACVAAGCLTARAIAIGELSPESSNRHLGFHVMITIAWLLITFAEFGIGIVDFANSHISTIETFEYFKIVALCAMMLVAACSAPLRSAAVWKRMKDDRPWRLMRHIFYSGGERGMGICIALTGLTLCVSDILLTLCRGPGWHGSNERILSGLLGFASQAILPIILARLAWRCCFSRRFSHPAGTVLCAAMAFWMTQILLATMDVTDSDELASGIFLFVIDAILFAPLYYGACVKPPR